MLEPGTTLQGGKYAIESRIGTGGFGITYRATHDILGSVVVIKEFYPRQLSERDSRTGDVRIVDGDSAREAYESGKKAFLAEGRFLYGSKHPNIVTVLDIFEEHNTAYLVMEFLDGHNLRELINVAPEKRLPEAQVREVGNAVVSALEYLHSRHICHLDIKPSNVMVCDDGRVVLIDFGAARQGNAISTQSFHSLSMDYAPPELLHDKEFGPETDIFELGVMLYELLTGTLPPRAVERLVGEDHWTPTHVLPTWRERIWTATRLKREDRPKDIHTWWTNDTIRQTDRIAAGAQIAAVDAANVIPLPSSDTTLPKWNVMPASGDPSHRSRRGMVVPAVLGTLAVAALTIGMAYRFKTDPPATVHAAETKVVAKPAVVAKSAAPSVETHKKTSIAAHHTAPTVREKRASVKATPAPAVKPVITEVKSAVKQARPVAAVLRTEDAAKAKPVSLPAAPAPIATPTPLLMEVVPDSGAAPNRPERARPFSPRRMRARIEHWKKQHPDRQRIEKTPGNDVYEIDAEPTEEKNGE